jgi:hypothetical protein
MSDGRPTGSQQRHRLRRPADACELDRRSDWLGGRGPRELDAGRRIERRIHDHDDHDPDDHDEVHHDHDHDDNVNHDVDSHIDDNLDPAVVNDFDQDS